ncbi:folic acid synthesis protein [Diplocarpon rosae]|nr:folic acid synthesis protein [Diplocarpon rosae]
MKTFRAGGQLWGRFTWSGHICPRPSTAFLKSVVPAHFNRYRSSSDGPAKSSEWTPYLLNPSKSTPSGSSPTPLISKKLTKHDKHVVYIALGSNVGDRVKWIERACDKMEKGGLHITRTSGLWETEPMYVKDQDLFLNGVAEVETNLSPVHLLDKLQSIERNLDRKKTVDKGPRNIDLDILLYDDLVVDHDRLTVPHPLMYEREFVLRPLAELIPGKFLNPAHPWKVTQDYLNDLPSSDAPISTLTPINGDTEPIRALDPCRSTRVMAILNASPESFSNRGEVSKKQDQEQQLLQSRETAYCESSMDGILDLVPAINFLYEKWGDSPMSDAVLKINGNKVICDVGGQSTAPGVAEVRSKAEKKRVLLALEQIHNAFNQGVGDMSRIPYTLSVDTYRAYVAEAAVKAGANIVNDVSAGLMDPEMLPTMARLGVTVVLMHMRGTPQTMNELTSYPDGLIPTIAKELLERVAAAEAAGVRRWRIILDPGIGFAKTAEQNIEILRRLDELRNWPGLRGLPWLVGSSRKSFIGNITGVKKPAERVYGTAATVAAAVQGGADIVRVHDIGEMEQVVKMADAIWRV